MSEEFIINLVALAKQIAEKEKEITELVAAQEYNSAKEAEKELSAMQDEAERLKAEIQAQDINEQDVQNLRSVQPARKSIQNMLESEVAHTTKFEKLLSDEMGEKSAYEMRVSDNAWRNDNSKTVAVVDIKARDISNVIQDRKNGIIEKGDFYNKDTGLTINFGNVGINDTYNYAMKSIQRNKFAQPTLAAIYQARELVENAICFDSQLSEKKKKSPNSLFVHRMYAVFNYNNDYYLANLAVDEFYKTDKNNKFEDTSTRLYNLKSIKITPIGNLGFQSHGTLSNGNGVPTSVITITIPQLYDFVKTYDQSFFENPNAAGRQERLKEISAKEDYLKSSEELERYYAEQSKETELRSNEIMENKTVEYIPDDIKFTENDSRDYAQVLVGYEMMKDTNGSAAQLDENNPYEHRLMQEMNNVKQFVKDAGEALSFTEASTVRTLNVQNDKLRSDILSLFHTKDDFTHTYSVLTGGNSETIKNILQKENKQNFHSKYISREELEGCVKRVLGDEAIAPALAEEANVTVGDVVQAIAFVKTLQNEYGITDKDNIQGDTIDTLCTKISNDRPVHILDTKFLDEQEEIQAEKPHTEEPQIVESNDGYVMNTSETITSDNAKSFADKHNVENVNEVHQAAPKETTSDISDVKPNVKFTNEEVGTKEKAQIDSGRGRDADIERLAKEAPSYKSQTDEGEKPHKKEKTSERDGR